MEFLRRFVTRSLIQGEAVERVQVQRDPPTHGIFGANRAAAQPGPARQTVALAAHSLSRGASEPPDNRRATNGSGRGRTQALQTLGWPEVGVVFQVASDEVGV